MKKSSPINTTPIVTTAENREIKVHIPILKVKCPITGRIDNNKVDITYLPATQYLELSSLEIYLHNLINASLVAEEVSTKILNDIVISISPLFAKVICYYEFSNNMFITSSDKFRKDAPHEKSSS